ncbi:autotransporter outer membrane beta-barrel domain-containing protein [Microbulbifer harenosus]|uniref:Autotransporter outer membrane beta-barrel domain-containing protein n=1 Tax=Microbulbifer harenosus TaxID=2576840 RepID=A0ABY2UJ59_9GAMM|nr:autotransporter outer membrane beta-barrel domain-containing protein [Microbulbifer harenosus]TLM78183.1 autotransporter outer membrane beta-barrel domain-containing protein [Microbulbifer harenosus]
MSYPRHAGVPDPNAPTLNNVALPPLLLLLVSIGASAQSAAAPLSFGAGNDRYTLTSNSPPGSDSQLLIDGGNGNDTLAIHNFDLANPARLQHWETIELTGTSRLTLNTHLTFGGEDQLPGQLVIRSGSTLLLPYYSAGISASGGQPLTVTNHGLVDMSGRSANLMMIQGDYVGIGRGSIRMDMVAGGDDSLADRLVISGGHASGSTQLLFNRLAGSGADTHNGILVVETRHGGSTSAGAFYMPEPISAGPYEYFLFRGTGDPANADNWYLRSTLRPGDKPATSPNPDFQSVASFGGLSAGTISGPATNITNANTGSAGASLAPPASTSDLLAAAPPAGSAPVPIYRPEIPLYAQAKSLARLTSLQEIGSYHKRRGEQRSWFDGLNQDWLRVHHLNADYNWTGDVSNRFDGNITGVQLGTNLWSGPTCTGGAREMGLFIGSTRASGDVSGFARGFDDYNAGQNQLTSHHIGYYFNDYRPDMGYFDFTAKVAYLKLESRSSRGIGDTISGAQLTLSVEKGFTWQAAEHVNVEPQLQVIANYSNFSAIDDGISWMEVDVTPEANFRAGLRAYNTDTPWLDGQLRLYVFGNVWHTLGGNDQLLFDTELQTDLERQATWGEVGGGVVLLEHPLGSAFLNVGYQRSLDSLDWSGGSANLGFNWAW